LKTYSFSRPARLTRINRQVLPSLSRSCLPLLVNPLFPTPIGLKITPPPWPLTCPSPFVFDPVPLKFSADQPMTNLNGGAARAARSLCRNLTAELRMSVPAVLNALFQVPNFLSAKSNAQSFQQEFQQLGQDLQSGNLSQAQSDLASLQTSNVPALSSFSSSNGLASAFSQLAIDLRSGNLSAARQDYTTIILPPARTLPPALRTLSSSFSPCRPGSAIRQSFPICLRFPATGIRSAWLCATHFRHFLFFLRLE
jgi:hypothetical protein